MVSWVVAETVGEFVRVGSPGRGVRTTSVGVLDPVALNVAFMAWEISGFFSANEMAKLPPTIIIEARAARSPNTSSRRLFMTSLLPLLRSRFWELFFH